MNKKDNSRKKDSQNRIETTFLELIQTHEIKDIKVSKICELANVNRTTFYANYVDLYDLIEKVKRRMILEYALLFKESSGFTSENFLKTFQHIYKHQEFYQTYFKLGFDLDYQITYLDPKSSKKYYDNQYVDYHGEFFRAGITALIKKWLKSGCKESPEEMLMILESEYKK